MQSIAFKPQCTAVQHRRFVSSRCSSEAQESTSASAPSQASATPMADVCLTCKIAKDQMPRGCIEGRIQGGIGTVPGFRWWPIKAYRPCPEASKRGLRYERKGQMIDEIIFNKPSE